MIYNGVIEGFFGKEWSHQNRLEMCTFISLHEYGFYIYAPKSDVHLRSKWQHNWPQKTFDQLLQLSKHCKKSGIHFGIGLSPFELHFNFNQKTKDQLKAKLIEIDRLQPEILCVLFDDMRGDKDNLAEIQANITSYIQDNTTAPQIIVCPSYYTEDPVLDEVFGLRPNNYLEELGQHLKPDINIFWTGSKVCSTQFTNSQIEEITKKLKRKPFLWDNYPVNDGAKMCNHLHLQGFERRSNLSTKKIIGHAINPMNQPWLSKIPLYTLPHLYQHQSHNINTESIQAITHLCEPELAKQLISDLSLFQSTGLLKMTKDERLKKTDQYRRLLNKTSKKDKYCEEILNWLEGNYKFDPKCLTE